MSTRLERFLKQKGITAAELTKATGYHRNHLYRIRTGKSEPTRECIAVILDACKRITGQPLEVEDLFEFTERRKAS